MSIEETVYKRMARRIEQLEAELASKEGVPYGIIDPDYAKAYTVIRKIAWEEGYAIGLHGSFTRDLDLIAVPWSLTARDPERVVRRICASVLKLRSNPNDPEIKPHGRKAWALGFPELSDPRFIDLSFVSLPAIKEQQ